MKDKRYPFDDHIEIVFNGRVYLVVKDGKSVAYGLNLREAQEYAKEYAGYKGE